MSYDFRQVLMQEHSIIETYCPLACYFWDFSVIYIRLQEMHRIKALASFHLLEYLDGPYESYRSYIEYPLACRLIIHRPFPSEDTNTTMSIAPILLCARTVHLLYRTSYLKRKKSFQTQFMCNSFANVQVLYFQIVQNKCESFVRTCHGGEGTM